MSATKGPWHIKNGRVVSEPRSGEGYAHGGEYVAISIGNEDDARLIAAAPELLDTLREMLQFDSMASLTTTPAGNYHRDLYFRAKALVAKAEGRNA